MSSSSATSDYVYRFAPTEIPSRPRSKLFMLMKGDSTTRTLSGSYERTASRSQTPTQNLLKARTAADAVEAEKSYRELATYLQGTVAYTKPGPHRKFVTASKKITARFFRVGVRCKLKWSQQRANRRSFDPYRPYGVVQKHSTNGKSYYEILPHNHLGTYLHTQKLRRDDSNAGKEITASDIDVSTEDLGDPLAGLEFPIPTSSFRPESCAERLQLDDVITYRQLLNETGPHSNFSRPNPAGAQPALEFEHGVHGVKRSHRKAALESLESAPLSLSEPTKTSNACCLDRVDCSTPEPAHLSRHSRGSSGSSSSHSKSSPSRTATNTSPAPSGPLPPLPLKSALRRSRLHLTVSPVRSESPTLGAPVAAANIETLSPDEVESRPQQAEQDLFDALHDAESAPETEVTPSDHLHHADALAVSRVECSGLSTRPVAFASPGGCLNERIAKGNIHAQQPEDSSVSADSHQELDSSAHPDIYQSSVIATDFAYLDTKQPIQDSSFSLLDLNFPDPPNRKRTSSESSNMRQRMRSALPRLAATTAAANDALNKILSEDEIEPAHLEYTVQSPRVSQSSTRTTSSRSHTPRSSGTSYTSSTLSSIHESDERYEILERENKMLQAALMAVLRTNGRLNSCPCGRGEDAPDVHATKHLTESCFDCDESSPTSPLEVYMTTKKTPEAGRLVRTLPLMTLSK